jgi:hypothetical protein
MARSPVRAGRRSWVRGAAGAAPRMAVPRAVDGLGAAIPAHPTRVERRFDGQVVDRRGRRPLSGYRVTGVDRTSRGRPIDLGYDITDPEGLFTLVYPASSDRGRDPRRDGGRRRVALRIVDPVGQPVARSRRVTVRIPGDRPVRVAITLPASTDGAAPTMVELAAAARLRVPPALRRRLRASGIRTVTDALAGGIASRLDGATPAAARRIASRLEAHAGLRLLSPDARVSTRLIARGYSSIDAVARAPRAAIVEALGDRLGELGASRLWGEARAQSAVLNNILAGARAELGNGRVPAIADGRILELFEIRCGCRDCETGVSPLAYLADLLDYATTHLTERGVGLIDLRYLTGTLHQPFGRLPATCVAMEEPVRQVRLCVEVLRSHLGRRPLPDRTREDALRDGEQRYRLNAYTTLLRTVGTSFDEIRLAHQLDPTLEDERTRLASIHDRLGVDFHEGQPKAIVDALHLDPTAPLRAPEAVTEGRLEELFGLVDTTRDPLDATANAMVPLLLEWRLAHLRTLWARADWPDDGLAERPLIDPDVIGPDDLRRPFPKTRPGDPDGPFDLWVQRRRLVDDRLIRYRTSRESRDLDQALREAFGDPLPDLDGLLARLGAGSEPERVAQEILQLGLTVDSFTRLMAIRSKDQRARRDPRSPAVEETEWQEVDAILTQVEKVRLFPRWRREERPIAFDAAHFWISLHDPREGAWPPPPLLGRPFIDPERLTLETLAESRPGRAAARLWRARQERLEELRQAIRAEREANGVPAMLRAALGHPAPGDPLQHDLAALARELDDPRPAVAERARRQITRDLHLTVEAARRLVDVGARAADPDLLRHPTPAEWEQVYGLLTTARKRKHEHPTWAGEEARLPLIDPDAVRPEDLAEPTAGQAARDLWQHRRDAVDQARREIRQTREAGGFDAMLSRALGHPRPGDPPQHDVARLADDLGSADQATAARARRWITGDLRLTIDGFVRLAAARAKGVDPDPRRRPTPAEWQEVEDLLAQAHQEKHLAPAWVREERRLGIDVEYWRALKATLPRWRAPAEARSQWQRALRVRTSPPLIDPDLIGPGDLKRPVAGDPAYDLWQRRHAWLLDPDPRTGQLAGLRALRQSHARPLPGLDAALESALGIPPAELVALVDQRAQGVDIARRLDQLTLTGEAFTHLARLRTLVERGERLVASEWEDVDSILAAVLKRREHARWRQEERAARLVLGPDHFRIPPRAPDGRSGEPAALPAWRATAKARREWQEILQARIDQETAVTQALRQAVSAAEEAALPALRNALVMATGAPGSALEARARWVTDHLLVDATTDACHVTTRVGQAIETLQGLLWSVRTGQLQDTYPALELDAEDFDAEWPWIGSYASWRAAMFVFLYPENVLIPTLRARQTPGFRRLADELRTSSRVTPELACRAARDYERYYRDVCHLAVEASCRARTRVHAGDCRDRADTGERDLFYVFARGAETNTLYWSAYDPGDETSDAQGFWEPVSGLDQAIRLIGAVPYEPDPDQRFIFLFALVQDEGEEKLAFLRYHLEQQAWDAEPTILEELPEDATTFSAVVEQHHRPAAPPHVAVRVPGGAIYDRSLNRDGSDWADGDWRRLVDASQGAGLTALHAMVESGERRFCLFATDLAGRVRYAEYQAVSLETRTRPAALRWPQLQSRADVFVRGEDGGLWHTWRVDGQDWAAWASLGGRLTSDPAAVSDAYGSVHVFALGRDGVLLHRHYRTNAWSSWESQGGAWSSAPGVASWGGSRLDVFLRGADNALYHRWRGALATPWQERRLPGPPGGAGSFAPAAISRNAGLIDLFVVTADGSLQHLSYEDAGAGWAAAWTEVHAGPWQSSPAVASFHPQHMALFLRQADLGLWHRNWPPLAGWQPEQSWRGLLTSDAAAIGRRQASDRRYTLEVFAKGADGGIWIGRHERISNTATGVLDWSGFTESVGTAVGEGQALFWRELGTGTWLGAVQWAQSDQIYAFWRDADGATRYAAIAPDRGVLGQARGGTWMDRLAVHAGGSFQADETLVVYTSRHPWLPYRSRATFQRAGWELTEHATVPVAPLVPSTVSALFTLTERMTADDRQERRRQLGAVFRLASATSWPRAIQAYLEEAHYFVPVHLAMQLQRRGHYVPALDWFRAVYDYSVPADRRKIYAGLAREETLGVAYQRPDDWLLDPLNPHGIASIRANTYTRFTLIALVRCLLDYADAEFTRDTAESVPRARTLYTSALELLSVDALSQRTGYCADRIGTLEIEVGSAIAQVGPGWLPVLWDLQRALGALRDGSKVDATVARVKRVLLERNGSWGARFARARALVERDTAPEPTLDLGGVLAERRATSVRAHGTLLADAATASVAVRVGSMAGRDLARDLAHRAGPGAPRAGAPGLGRPAPPPAPGGAPGAGRGLAAGLVVAPPFGALGPGRRVRIPFLPTVSYRFCVPPNPLLESLRLHAELNLFKIRTCRNIAGMERALDPYAAPTDATSGLPAIGAGGQLVLPGTATLRPTLYRYSAIVERAKQLAHLAGQIESALLAALEKRDAEYYSLMKARQDVQLARAEIVLQDLRVTEAKDGVALARLQQQRAQIQADHYEALIEENLTILEQLAIGFMVASGVLQLAASGLYLAAAVQQLTFTPVNKEFSISGGLSSTAAAASSLAGAASTTSSILSTYASYERRKQDWEFQRTLAEHDVQIGAQQVDLAEDRVRVVGQERRISEIRQDHAKDTADYLATKFTNVDLYDWMSDVLEGVYSSFLRQATAVAKVAEQQLAFERQEPSPAFIQADYWEAPTGLGAGAGTDGAGPDRRGLTGSARLLRDLHELDQYAFETNQRKLQLSKTLSLARLAPAEFQRFRETGVMSFATPMTLFDRDFPGDYLRLIRQVRVSLLALLPPPQEIRATLSTTGTARTVLGGPVFQAVRMNYGPQSVALSSPRDATGVFELQAPSDLRLPFEGLGVDTSWELRMPRASNLFDYTTIADVLVTIDYTALHSPDYRQQVVRDLDRRFTADRSFSFRHQFADPWYDLHHPDRTATPMQVRFRTERADFPPGLEALKIQHVLLYVVAAAGRTFEAPPVQLRFAEQGAGSFVGGEAVPTDRVVSTRRGNAGSWTSMVGRAPAGEWELSLPDTAEVRRRFGAGDIEDILFVITYSGLAPEWPA